MTVPRSTFNIWLTSGFVGIIIGSVGMYVSIKAGYIFPVPRNFVNVADVDGTRQQMAETSPAPSRRGTGISGGSDGAGDDIGATIPVAIRHKTIYTYDRLVSLGPQVVRLRPAPHCRTPILSYSMKIEPDGHFLNWQQDPHGNHVARLVFPKQTDRFTIDVDLMVDMSAINPFDFFLDEYAEKYPFQYETSLKKDLLQFLDKEPPGPQMRQYLKELDRTSRRTIDFLGELNTKVQGDIKYQIRMEPGVQTPEDSLRLRTGSCRDSAWFLVQLLRNCGLASRFVSGYLIQLTPSGKSPNDPPTTEVDFTDLHAWCEVYLPGAGWIGLDPTSGLLCGEGHVPLACTPAPAGAAPIDGTIGDAEAKSELNVEMTVTRIQKDLELRSKFDGTGAKSR